MEKDVKVRSKIRGALIYPAFIICAMIGVAILMLTEVIPQIETVFASSGQSLPITTQSLIDLSNLVIHDWYWLLIGLIAIIYGTRAFARSQAGIKFFSEYSLKTPIVGSVIEQSSMARFGRLLGMLLSSGVPLLEALKLITDSFTNDLFRHAFIEVSQQVERGVPMSVPITENPIFPIMVGQMVSVGEQTGKMDEVMTRLAEYYEAQVDTKVNSISTLIEPMVIILLGCGVAWLVIGILLPIYQISSNPGSV